MLNNTICIIPARGGSKRIPEKNIKLFLGKPIISYSIKTAKVSNLFNRIIVSTDDQKVAKIAKSYGAEVPFMRSEKNSDDFSTTADVIDEVLGKLSEKYKFVCCMYPTAPLLTPNIITSSFSKLIENDEITSVLPVVKYSFPVQRAVKINNKKIVSISPEFTHSRSQDLESTYHDCGQFYWIKVKDFLIQKEIIMDNTSPYILNELQVQDIDNESDWKIAELKYKLMTLDK